MHPSVIFFGNERLATGLTSTDPIVLRSLIEHGHKVAAVVSRNTPSRSRNTRALEVETLANHHAIPMLKPENKADLIAMVRNHPAEIGVLAAFGMIVPQEVIDAFAYGIINLHPSLLPQYRGTTPIEQAILDGIDETGVSVMQLDARMDAGPVLAQRRHKLTGSETKAELADSLHKLGAELIIKELEKVLAGKAEPVPQDETAATFCSPLTKRDGIIDWHKPAVQLEREVRAYAGWPGSRTALLGREVTIMQARVAPEGSSPSDKPGNPTRYNSEIWVNTGTGTLAIQRLKPDGKREMGAAEFWRGQRVGK